MKCCLSVKWFVFRQLNLNYRLPTLWVNKPSVSRCFAPFVRKTSCFLAGGGSVRRAPCRRPSWRKRVAPKNGRQKQFDHPSEKRVLEKTHRLFVVETKFQVRRNLLRRKTQSLSIEYDSFFRLACDCCYTILPKTLREYGTTSDPVTQHTYTWLFCW